MDVRGRTDVGRTREHNEDAFLVADVSAGAPLPTEGVAGYSTADRALVFMVADGMGGAAAGEIASAMAVHTVMETVSAAWMNAPVRNAAGFARALREAAEEANRRIHAAALEQPEFRGMGTTATIAGLLGDTLYLAQVGDSRAYLVRDGRALQITKDQSLLQRLVEAGEMTAEEAERSARRNIILQALGPEPSVTIDLTHQLVRRGDLLILCSDGLSGLVREEEIAHHAVSGTDVCDVTARLIAAANEQGGPDNITVIAVKFDGAGLATAGDGDRVGHQRFAESDSDGEDDWINGSPTLTGYSTDTGTPAVEASAAQGAVTSNPTSPAPATDGETFRGATSDRREKGRIWMACLLILLVLTAGAALWRWLL